MKQTEKKRRYSLKLYLAAGFLIFSVLLMIVLWLFQTVFLESFYKRVKTGQVKDCAGAVADCLDSDNLSDLITDIEEQNNMAVAIFIPETNIITSAYTSKNNFLHFNLDMTVVRELYRCAQENGGEYSTVTHTGIERRYNKNSEQDKQNSDSPFDRSNRSGATPDEPSMNRDEPFFPDDRRYPDLERENVETLAYVKLVTAAQGERIVIVQSEITPVSSVVDTLRYQLTITTIVLAVLSLIAAIVIANMISKPISRTNEKAKALARRDYDLTFSGGRYREIKELNSTLNYAASELKKVDNLQKELIANISHDLRTPLTNITGYAEVMRDLPGEMTPENIQIIIDEASRLKELVSDLLDISRLQSGTADIKKIPFCLTDCIRSIFSRYTKLIESEGLNLVFEHDREVFVNGDELRMTQVIYNLINNAINYIGEDKTVLVRQSVTDNTVRIEVIDHGEGIPQDKLEYIWERYYRVDKEHRRAVVGTGLGLSIVRNILLAHDADFGVASKLGEGSDFYFSMPIISPDGED